MTQYDTEHPTAAAPVVRVEGLAKPFGPGERAGLHDIELSVGGGEWVAIMGRSGSGKSTLLQLLGGLDMPAAGVVEVAGIRMSELGESARALARRRHVAYVFQRYNLIDELTASGNVELALALAGRRRGRAAEARAILSRLGLEDRVDALPARLSGGEQQQVAIARAIAVAPAVLLADEPTGALDTENAVRVLDLFRATSRQGQTIVMVTHDPAVAAAADRVVWMDDGRLSAHRANHLAEHLAGGQPLATLRNSS